MRNKYGIIDFGKLSAILDDTLGSMVTTEITDILSQEQKNILYDIWLQNQTYDSYSKLVYIHLHIDDSADETFNFKGIGVINGGNLLLFSIDGSDNIRWIELFYDSGVKKYYAYS